MTPPLKSVENCSVPPDETFSVPPETAVPEPDAPDARPPDKMFSTAPQNNTTLLVELPDWLMTPPDPAISWTAPPAFAIRESLSWMVRPELVTPDEATVVVVKSSPPITLDAKSVW